MLATTYILTIIYAWLGKNKRSFWFFCALLLMIIVNTSVKYADFENYEFYFNGFNEGIYTIKETGLPIGWYYLCLLFGTLGLSYRAMVVFIIAVSMYLIHSRIKKYDIKEGIFWGLFIIFPGLIQCVQIRFFLGTTIVFWGLIPLLNNEKNSLIKYIASVLIAYIFHASCMIFIVFAFLPLFNHFAKKRVMLICLAATIVIYFGLSYIPELISPFIPSNRVERYFQSETSVTTFSWFIQILMVWLIGFLIAGILKKKIDNTKDEYMMKISNNIKNIISLLFVTIPFLAFDRNFHRFLELGYMLIFILLAYYWKKMKLNGESKLVLMSISLILILGITYIYTPIETVIIPFFTFSGFHSMFL